MSRSYRKNYILKTISKFDKKYSNRIVRRKLKDSEDCNSNPSFYKKLYDSDKIQDPFEFNGYKSLESWKKVQLPYYDSEEDCIKAFNRWWKSK